MVKTGKEKMGTCVKWQLSNFFHFLCITIVCVVRVKRQVYKAEYSLTKGIILLVCFCFKGRFKRDFLLFGAKAMGYYRLASSQLQSRSFRCHSDPRQVVHTHYSIQQALSSCLRKNCANFFLTEFRQIFTNFGNFWQKDSTEAKIMQGALNFYLT